MMDNKIVVIVGPTASGKTALSLALAEKLNGEIVSCDSMQIYKHMNIGTAKPDPVELSRAVHHMIDIAETDLTFSCAEFASLAKSKIDDILSRGKLPILCGGTGLYIDSIVNETEFSAAEDCPEYREELFRLAEEKGNEYIYKMLETTDPESAAANHPNNLKRVIRALEIFHATGVTKTEWDRRSHLKKPKYDPAFIGLNYADRESLYSRIDRRVDIMMQNGLLDEVKSLYESGLLREGMTASQAIGYKEIISALKGNISIDEAVEAIKRESRRYAKRQLTWFKRNPDIFWIYPDNINENDDTFKIIVNNAISHLNERGFCVTI